MVLEVVGRQLWVDRGVRALERKVDVLCGIILEVGRVLNGVDELDRLRRCHRNSDEEALDWSGGRSACGVLRGG